MRTKLIFLLTLLMLVVASSALRKKSNSLMLTEDSNEWVNEDGSRCVRTWSRAEPDNPNGGSSGGYCIDKNGKRTPWAIA